MSSADEIQHPHELILPLMKEGESIIKIQSGFLQYFFSVLIVLCVALACFPFTEFIGYRTVSLILLLTISLLPLRLGRGPVLVGAAMGAITWNYFFIPPLFALTVKHAEDILMLAMFFIVATVTGTLSARLRERENIVRQREMHSSALFTLTKDLSSAHTLNEVIKAAVLNIKKYFNADVVVFLCEADGDMNHKPHPASSWIPDEKEASVAAWTYWNEKKAGRHTDKNNLSQATYFSMSGPRYPVGVIGVKLNSTIKTIVDYESLLENFIAQITSAAERELLNETAKKSVVVAESERLYKTLFNSLSHELKTPISAILGASENLLLDQHQHTSAAIKDLSMEIHTAGERLNRLVANLLDMTRIESGMIKPKEDWCDVNDLINLSIKGLEQEITHNSVSINVSEDVPLIKLDFGLMEQVLTNLIYNASVHTPKGTSIEILAYVENEHCVITVADNGPGILKPDIKKIFDKFYRAEGSTPGGTGLGLPIAKGFIEAQRGTLSVRNRVPSGAEFTIEIPIYNKSAKS